MADRIFPTPWLIVENAESFRIDDGRGMPVAYVYFEDNEQRRNMLHRMTKREAWNIARAIAVLPDVRSEVRMAVEVRSKTTENDPRTDGDV